MSDLEIPGFPGHGMVSNRSELKYGWILGPQNRRSKLKINLFKIYGVLFFNNSNIRGIITL